MGLVRGRGKSQLIAETTCKNAGGALKELGNAVLQLWALSRRIKFDTSSQYHINFAIQLIFQRFKFCLGAGLLWNHVQNGFHGWMLSTCSQLRKLSTQFNIDDRNLNPVFCDGKCRSWMRLCEDLWWELTLSQLRTLLGLLYYGQMRTWQNQSLYLLSIICVAHAILVISYQRISRFELL